MTRGRTRCVLDASAAAAVLFREPGFGAVLASMPPAGWIVPPLFGIEVANVAKHETERGLAHLGRLMWGGHAPRPVDPLRKLLRALKGGAW